MIRTLIVENEHHIATSLQDILQRHFADLMILAVCDTVESTLEAIETHRPELVFLDVELNHGETAFDILRRLASIDFKIIFTTSFDQYAIQAIKFSALDFLLKPVDEEELCQAVRKFAANRDSTSPAQHKALISYQPGNQDQKIGLPEMDGLIFVQVSEILYCEGASAQSCVHLTDKQYVVSRTLKVCEEMLDPLDFCRIHKSHIVNLRHVTRYFKGDGGYVVLSNSKHLDVSATYKATLLERLKKL